MRLHIWTISSLKRGSIVRNTRCDSELYYATYGSFARGQVRSTRSITWLLFHFLSSCYPAQALCMSFLCLKLGSFCRAMETAQNPKCGVDVHSGTYIASDCAWAQGIISGTNQRENLHPKRSHIKSHLTRFTHYSFLCTVPCIHIACVCVNEVIQPKQSRSQNDIEKQNDTDCMHICSGPGCCFFAFQITNFCVLTQVSKSSPDHPCQNEIEPVANVFWKIMNKLIFVSQKYDRRSNHWTCCVSLIDGVSVLQHIKNMFIDCNQLTCSY